MKFQTTVTGKMREDFQCVVRAGQDLYPEEDGGSRKLEMTGEAYCYFLKNFLDEIMV